MPNIKFINDASEIPINNTWTPSAKFNCKNKPVTYRGRQYRIIEKTERSFSALERFGRGFLGVIAVVCTLSLALLSKSVRNLFVKSTENIRFAVLAQQDNSEAQEGSAVSSSAISTNKAVQTLKILPVVEKDATAIKELIKNFKDRALNVFNKSIQQQSAPECTLTEEQQQSLLEANRTKYHRNLPAGVKVIRGGVNFVIFLDSVPGFVFKPMQSKELAKSYIDVTKKAHEAISKNNLYLIHIPKSELVEINGEYFIMQEKAELISGDHHEIKGIYSHCWNDTDMNSYIKAVFSQLLEFISQTSFSDVKYDNLPLTTDGRVALIDLDERSVIGGLTVGGGNKNDGLFNYIPHEHVDEFLNIAKEKLKDDSYQELLEKIGVIKTRAHGKITKKEAYAQFCQNNKISFASQSINPSLPKIFDDKKKQEFATSIVTILNKNLSKSKNVSIQTGRKVRVAIDVHDPLFNRAKEIWGDQFPYVSYPASEGEVTFKTILPEILAGLKRAGYIYEYKISAYYPFVKVSC